MPIVNVPKVLRDKLGEEGVEALVSLINAAGDHTKTEALALSRNGTSAAWRRRRPSSPARSRRRQAGWTAV